MITAAAYWYDALSGDGRERLLLGTPRRRQMLEALCSCIDLQEEYYLFVEFPLIGEPFMDFVASQRVAMGTEPTPRGEHALYKDVCFEFDLSKEDHPKPGELIFNMSVPEGQDVEERILQELGADSYRGCYQKQLEKMPEGFIFRYSGIFSRRNASPLRMAYCIHEKRLDDYRKNIGCFAEDMRQLGYAYVCEDMINSLNSLLPYVDGQLEVSVDLLKDGTLGPKAGIVLFTHSPHLFPASAEDFYGSNLPQLFAMLEAEGQIDHRWTQLPDILYAVELASPFELSGKRILSMNQMHSVKFSWSAGYRNSPKIYMRNHTVIE